MPLGKLSTAWNVHLYNVNSDCSYPRKSLSTSVRRYDSFLEDTLTSLAGDWATGQPLPTFHPYLSPGNPRFSLGWLTNTLGELRAEFAHSPGSQLTPLTPASGPRNVLLREPRARPKSGVAAPGWKGTQLIWARPQAGRRLHACLPACLPAVQIRWS